MHGDARLLQDGTVFVHVHKRDNTALVGSIGKVQTGQDRLGPAIIEAGDDLEDFHLPIFIDLPEQCEVLQR